MFLCLDQMQKKVQLQKLVQAGKLSRRGGRPQGTEMRIFEPG